jgi:hypothetical protein
MKKYVEEKLAADFPGLWRIQIHWVALASITGFLLCLLQRGLSALQLSDPSMAGWLTVVQFGFAFYWIVLVFKVPTPEGILWCLNSPSGTTIVLCILAVLAGPIVIFGFSIESLLNDDQAAKTLTGALFLLTIQFVFGLCLLRYASATGIVTRWTSGQRFAGLFIGPSMLVLLLIYFCSSLIDPGFYSSMIALGGFLVVAAARVAFCFRIRQRTAYDMVLLNLSFVIPFFMLIELLEERDLWRPASALWKPLAATSEASGMAAGFVFISLFVSVFTIVWVDLACFILARFVQLPRRGR